MPSKFVGDDEEAKAYVLIPGGDEDDVDEPDDPEKAEDEFLEWSDAMDERDAQTKRRADALATIASHGVDVTASPDDTDVPLMQRSDAYVIAFAQARVDGEWSEEDHPRGEHGMFGEGSGGSSEGEKLHYHPSGKGTGGSVATQVAAMSHAKDKPALEKKFRDAAEKAGGRLSKEEALKIANEHLGSEGGKAQAQPSGDKKTARIKSKTANKMSDRVLAQGNSAQGHEHERAAELHDVAAQHHEAAGNKEEAGHHREAASQHRNLASLNTEDMSWSPDEASTGRHLRHAAKYRKAAKEAVSKVRSLNTAARAGGD